MFRPVQRKAVLSRRAWLRRAGGSAAAAWLGLQMAVDRRAFGQEVVIDAKQALNVKGAYMYSFCRFVTWPDAAFAEKDAPLVIAVLGSPNMTATLQDVAKKRPVARGHKLEIKKVAKPEESVACHLLVMTAEVQADQQLDVIKRYEGASVLIVTETNGMGLQGAHVNFFLDGPTVKFEINVRAAQKSNLQIDPQMTALKVARLLAPGR